MTQMEIEREALGLPEDARAALAQKLIASLSVSQQGTLEASEADLRTWLESFFTGPSEELTDEMWEEMAAEPSDEELDRPLGLAVPPEWTGRTLREMRAAAEKS